MVDRHHDLIGVEAEQAGGVFQGVDGGAVDVGLACFPQAAVADVGAESAEQAGQGGRPAVHGRGLHHLGGEEAAPGHASQPAWPMWARLAAQARVVGWSGAGRGGGGGAGGGGVGRGGGGGGPGGAGGDPGGGGGRRGGLAEAPRGGGGGGRVGGGGGRGGGVGSGGPGGAGQDPPVEGLGF